MVNEALILCGGLGTRLSPIISVKPKCMAIVKGKPFLDYVVQGLIDGGVTRIIFCVGYLKNSIITRYTDWPQCQTFFSEETRPLGTGGAIKNALSFLTQDNFLVLNGDSFCKVDFKSLMTYHDLKSSTASMVLTKSNDRNDVGKVFLGENDEVLSFNEKSDSINLYDGHVNAGIYVFDKQLFQKLKDCYPLSLEEDIMPLMIKNYKCYGFLVESKLLDIGTPERYMKAEYFFNG